jgi:RES domain-containing protein
MRLWRICKTRYAHAPLDGSGALFAEGRWHGRGTRIVYAASTPSLAALETLAHTDPDLMPAQMLLEIEAPIP